MVILMVAPAGFMLHFHRLQHQHQFHLRLEQLDSPWTLTYILWQNAWNDGTNTFRFQIRQTHGDDESMHVRKCDTLDGTPNLVCQQTPLWWKFCAKERNVNVYVTKPLSSPYRMLPRPNISKPACELIYLLGKYLQLFRRQAAPSKVCRV